MSTVPKADTPPPANNAQTLTVSDAWSHGYGRPTAGGNASGDVQTPSGAVPANPINGQLSDLDSPLGAPVSAGDTQTGPNMGHGATQIVAQPDATGHPSGDTSGGGTVGNSGQGLGQ